MRFYDILRFEFQFASKYEFKELKEKIASILPVIESTKRSSLPIIFLKS
jgi:hypothetical protein